MQNKFHTFVLDKYGTVAEFARRLGVTWMTANAYVRGTQPMNSDRINALADQTGVPVCEIINLLKK